MLGVTLNLVSLVGLYGNFWNTERRYSLIEWFSVNQFLQPQKRHSKWHEQYVKYS